MSRVSWGAIWAGVFVALFFQMLLGLLGLAIGLTAIDIDQQILTRGLGIGAGVWLLVSTLISVFLGAFTAGRLAGLSAKYDGLLHGVVTLAFLVVLSIFLATTGISTAIGGAFSLLVRTAQIQQVQQAAPQIIQQQTAQQQQQQALTEQQRQQIAQQAQAVATRTAWWTFAVGLLALISAMVGGYLGMQSRVNQIIREAA
ncbi:MAG: hypothetical protein MZU97_10790 [Bacillus subtilis]|nr:hypothetical protein [Bacillus subtilis]